MQKLEAVEIARALMTEGQDWSVVRWLFEKRKVREAADKATAALAEANDKVKSSWGDELRRAYAELVAEAAADANPRAARKAKQDAQNVDAKIKLVAKRVKESDDEANQATMDAEEMFAEAERRMSASMARAAAQKALESYDLREKAIRKAEAARRGS